MAWYRRQDRQSRTALAESLTASVIEHTEEMARYRWESGARAIVSDTFATAVGSPDWSEALRPYGFLHRVLIGRLGPAIGELWDLAELGGDGALDGCYQFLLVSGQVGVPRGIGSPGNARAIA